VPSTAFIVSTNRYDNNRSGANLSETTLTQSNVTKGSFGLRFSMPVDGQVYAQPLYLSGIKMNDGKTHNVVFIATQHNVVYAFDADSAANPLWQHTFGTPGSTSEFGCSDMLDTIGITSTPVIDPNTGTLYFVEKSKENGAWIQRIHAVDITNGSDRAGSPVEIKPHAAGTGDGSSGGQVPFNPAHALARAGLLLQGGRVYVAFASHCDKKPYHGWIVGYDTTLNQKQVFLVSPNGSEGGIWQAGVGLSSDGASLFFAAGNGSTSTDGSDLSLAVGRLNLSDFKVADYWTPTSYKAMNGSDADLSTGAVLIAHNLLLSGSKDGRLYVLDRANLGKYSASGDRILQTISTQGKLAGDRGHLHGGPIYYDHPANGETVFVWPEESVLVKYTLNSDKTLSDPTYAHVAEPGHPGGILSLSANGNAAGSGILWAAVPQQDAWHSTEPGTLYAFDPGDLHILWHSEQNATRDSVGNFAKFNTPVVANGKVYVPTFSGKIQVYGLL